MVEIHKEDKGMYVKLILTNNGSKEAFKYVKKREETREAYGHACRDLFVAWCMEREDLTSKYNESFRKFL